MSEELTTIEPDDPLALLNERELKVAHWLASSAMPGTKDDKSKEPAKSGAQMALELGCHRATLYKTASRDSVRAAARFLIRSELQTDTVPRILRNVQKEAMTDAKLGLKFLEYLAKLGIDPLIGGDAPGQGVGETPEGVTLTVPGGFDALVRAQRREQ